MLASAKATIDAVTAPRLNDNFKPFHSIHEFLNALHIYADEASKGVIRHVEATHFCSHVRKDLRQCLIYESNAKDARLIGVEYMIPKEKYLRLDEEERKLWHSHEFEVKSGMLILPKGEGFSDEAWEEVELGAMREVVGLYGKTFHFWEIDAGHDIPLGYPKLMGSLTQHGQLDLDVALKERDKREGVSYKDRAEKRKGIQGPGVADDADSWYKVAGAAAGKGKTAS